MHAETLAYMFHQLPLERKIAPANYRSLASSTPDPAVKAKMIEIPAGEATLGIPRDARVFGWDNEFEAYSVHVPARLPSTYTKSPTRSL